MTVNVMARREKKLDSGATGRWAAGRKREQGITIDVAYRYFSTENENLLSPTRRAMNNIPGIWWRPERPPAIWRSY